MQNLFFKILKALGVNIETINLSVSCFYLSSGIFAFPSIELIKNFGVNFSFKISIFFMFVAFGLRILNQEDMYGIIFGNFLLGISSNILNNTHNKLISSWFGKKEV